MTTMKPLSDILAGADLTMTARRVPKNPNMGNENMDHWLCKLKCGHDTMTVYFSKGYGHHGAVPTIEEVMDCLASDAADADNARSFESWCSEYGYDTDSRKAERIYKVCVEQAERLRNLLGPSLYAAVLYEAERL